MDPDQSKTFGNPLYHPTRETPHDSFPQSTTEMKVILYQDRKRKKLTPQSLLTLLKRHRHTYVEATDFTSNHSVGKNQSRTVSTILQRSQECWDRNG